MKNRTYRYFEGQPLYPFGFGLSYTTFQYSALQLDRNSLAADGSAQATVTVKNTGKRTGDEVVQLYLQPLDPKRTRARKELRGIERITLPPGESRTVTFTVQPARDLAIYDAVKKAYAVDAGKFAVQIGASSADIRAQATLTVDD
jgi:beta-glucosidase